MRILITCGPACEPIDAVRRIVNHSTGELGALLAGAFLEEGCEVICLRGTSSIFPPPPSPAKVIPFLGNGDFDKRLRELAGWPDVVLHSAALADFLPANIRSSDGRSFLAAKGKIPSDAPDLLLTLRPAPKSIALLRPLFPAAFLVGWKYEAEGTEQDAIARATGQIQARDLDACVANGPVCADRLLWLRPNCAPVEFPDKPAFARAAPNLCARGNDRSAR